MSITQFIRGLNPVILLKMSSGDAWYADASVNGTLFKLLMDTGASKSVMSMKRFLNIPELFRLKLYNEILCRKWEVSASMGDAHVTISMYGYTFNLPILVCDMGEIDCIFGLDAGTVEGFITCARTGRL